MHPSMLRIVLFGVVGMVIVGSALFLAQCSKRQPDGPVEVQELPPLAFESSGEDFLIAALDEVEFLSGAALPDGAHPASVFQPLSKADADSVYVYGQVDQDGVGAVVTERRAYPKGMLLITVRTSHGGAGGRVVTETRRYISMAGYLADQPQQSSITELYCPSTDTIVTHVLRNGTLDTYTFRLPVVTRVVNPQDGSVRITKRFGLNGMVVSEITDGNGAFVQRRLNNGLAEGSIVTRTEYADSSWRSTRTVGLADGTVFREVTSGQ